MFGQVRELLTNYGRIDLIWFDGQWEHTPDQWQVARLTAMIRELQPDIVINDRLPDAGDYDTPEQFVPAKSPARPWEVCLTMNDSWGYCPDDKDYKSARQLVHTLCEITARGGRLLLNVSPKGDGMLPEKQVERLQALGAWLARNGEAIFNTQPGLQPWQFYGPTTKKGDTIYQHLLMRPYDTVTVRDVPIRRVKAVREVSFGHDLPFSTRCSILDQLLNADPRGELTIAIREGCLDEMATVIAVEFTPIS
jgi:alpha-L-fucosidase